MAIFERPPHADKGERLKIQRPLPPSASKAAEMLACPPLSASSVRHGACVRPPLSLLERRTRRTGRTKRTDKAVWRRVKW
jgi:hypothetical protein